MKDIETKTRFVELPVMRVRLSAVRHSIRRTSRQVTRACRIVDICVHPLISPPFFCCWEDIHD
jgi:hypothetical protein